MTIPQSVAEILREHVTLEVEGVDRMYHVPRLQIVEGVLGFIRRHRGYPVASTRMVEPTSFSSSALTFLTTPSSA